MFLRIRRNGWEECIRRLDALVDKYARVPNIEWEVRLGTWDVKQNAFVPGMDAKAVQALQSEWVQGQPHASHDGLANLGRQHLVTEQFDGGLRRRRVTRMPDTTTSADEKAKSADVQYEYLRKQRLEDVTIRLHSSDVDAPKLAIRISISTETPVDPLVFEHATLTRLVEAERSSWRHDLWTYEFTQQHTRGQQDNIAFEIEYQGDKQKANRLAADTMWRSMVAWSWFQTRTDPVVTLEIVKTSM